jgi:hypothetical protein
LSMFYTLHRLYLLAWVALILGAGFWLYPRAGVSEPLVNWYEVWQNTHGVPTRPVELLSGKVIKITEPNAFMLRGSDHQSYSVALLGTVPSAVLPATPTKPRTEPESVREAKERLSDLILSNEVSVEVTVMDPFRRGVGIVHLGETNINAVMVESGLLELKRDYIKGLPLSDQYALIRADRRAKSRNLAAAP